jgi:hypothetical protein
MVLKSSYLFLIAVFLIALPLHITPVRAQSCPHDGDVNQDGSLTPTDALLTFRHFLGLAEPPLNTCQQAHANVEDPESSGITPADALCIFRKYLGFLSCLDPLPAVVSDRDGDGIPDADDDFPDDPAEFRDSDRNGTGNFAQLDEDGDLSPDTEDEFPFAPNKNTYPAFAEVEPNEVPFMSLNNVFGPYPLRITGTFDADDWTDSFAFSATQ